jgi:hypothetical protein
VDVAALLRAVAAFGLPDSSVAAPARPLSEPVWSELLVHARWQRLTNLLAQAVSSGVLPATEPQIAAAIDADIPALTGVLRLEAQLLEVADIFDGAGVRFRVLKGSAVAHLDYPDPAWRCFGDLDLLIPPDAMDDAIGLLSGLGYARRFPQPRDGFDSRFTKSVSLDGPDGQQLDLHRTLAAGGFGHRIIVDMLWSAPSSRFTLGGREFAALGVEERLLHACYHLVLGNAPPRLVPQRDVAEMLHNDTVAVDRVLIIASAWQGEAILARAITTTVDNLRLSMDSPLVAWAREFKPGMREQRELARATSPRYSYAAQAIDSVRAIHGPRERLAYVSALAFPRRSYVRGRYSGPGARARHALLEGLNIRSTMKESGD